MKLKLVLVVFLTLILLGSVGVKKSWASQLCCLPLPDQIYVPNEGACLWTNNANPPQYAQPLCHGYACSLSGSDYICDPSVIATPNPIHPTFIVITQAPTGNSPFDPCKNLAAGKPEDDCRKCTGMSMITIPPAGGPTLIFTACGVTPGSNIGASCGTWTSLGCIPNDPPNLVGWIITLASGVAGGIAFLLILFGSFQIVTSGGVPEKIAGGKDIITSALLGLLFIFLATLILKVIGVQILGIPGWQ